MAHEPTHDVFLSHAASDRAAVEELARRLESAGLKPFFPEHHLVAGMAWRLLLEEGLNKSETLAVFFGADGPDEVEKWEIARWMRENGNRVIPVLLPGAVVSELPDFLQILRWVDFRSGLADPVAFNHLIAAIEGPAWEEEYTGASPLPPVRKSGRPIPTTSLSRIRLPRFRLPRFDFRPIKDVWLATAAPPSVARNSKFVARFSAYTQEYRSQVTKAVIAEAPEAKLHLDLHTCQWEPGAKVTVMLSAEPLHVEDPAQSFVWNGKWEILKFDVSVPDSIDEGGLILKFDVYVEGLKIAKLRPELKIVHSQTTQKAERELTATKAPDKAFASYASLDLREVIGRIRSLQAYNHVNVFIDCLSIHPGEKWKDVIEAEIRNRDIFWLFWSRNAMQSKWVDWEWRTALATKTLDYIQPHPLESPDVAPPPAELAALQFGSLYESLPSQPRNSRWNCRITQCRRAARRAVGLFWFPAILVVVLLVIYVVWFR